MKPNPLQDSIIGHGTICGLLEKMLARGRIPHALLFGGPPSVGKQTVARAFAASLLARERTFISPEETVLDTKKIRQVWLGQFPDLHLLSHEEDKKDIPVEAVRVLREKLQLKPYYGTGKIAIIDDAHKMSSAAVNALLMTLEEPPKNTYLILVSDAAHRLPATVLSRCQMVHFSFLTVNELRSIIERILTSIDAEREYVDELLRITDGTLAPLHLDRFFDPLTLRVNDASALREHLSQLQSETRSLVTKLSRHTSSGKKPAISHLLSLASELAQDKAQTEIAWSVLVGFIRTHVRNNGEADIAQWADILSQSLEMKRLITERNASPQTQLASLMLRICERHPA